MPNDQTISAILDDLIRTHQSRLSANDRAFLRRVFSTDPELYRTRLRALGFVGLRRVLDAGCGFGQWSLALAQLNDRVASVDANAARIRLLDDILQRTATGNVEARAGRLEQLPYADGSFDAAFCYIALFYCDWRAALGELVRVLRPGGRLYVTGNGIGWYLHLWFNRPNATSDYEPREIVARTFADTVEYERSGRPPNGQLIIEPAGLATALEASGLAVLARGAEGTIHADQSAPPPRPFFEASYFGQVGCYEILAQKQERPR
ncbi:MAG: class I SAM-dependent methyltransferase [Planctomycetota bacterium]|nr:class I SAM-dependent methyltransferase [Planctomycetota bacterium]